MVKNQNFNPTKHLSAIQIRNLCSTNEPNKEHGPATGIRKTSSANYFPHILWLLCMNKKLIKYNRLFCTCQTF